MRGLDRAFLRAILCPSKCLTRSPLSAASGRISASRRGACDRKILVSHSRPPPQEGAFLDPILHTIAAIRTLLCLHPSHVVSGLRLMPRYNHRQSGYILFVGRNQHMSLRKRFLRGHKPRSQAGSNGHEPPPPSQFDAEALELRLALQRQFEMRAQGISNPVEHKRLQAAKLRRQ